MKTFNIVYEPRVEDPVTIAKLETRKEAEEYIEMIKNTNAITYNCTRGGIIFDKSIKWTSLKKFCNR